MKARSCALIAMLFLPMTVWAFSIAGAQEKFPSRPINMLVGYAAGGATDGVARAIGEAAKKIFGVPLVVVNKPGAGTAIAMETAKNAKPDGYTIVFATTSGLSQATLGNATYNFFTDFTPVCNLTAWLIAFGVSSSSPWKTFQEFQAYAQAHPGEIKFGASGIGSSAHLAAENLSFKAGFKMVHVPMTGGPEIMSNVLGGHLQGASSDMWDLGNFARAGKLRLLVVISEKRIPGFPDVPTPEDLGLKLGTVGAVTLGPVSILGPRGMPNDVVKTLAESFRKAAEDPIFQNFLKQSDHEYIYRGPDETQKLWREYEDWSVDIMKRIGMMK